MYAKEISNIIEDMTIPITALIFIRSPDFIDLILKIPIVVPEIAKIIGKENTRIRVASSPSIEAPSEAPSHSQKPINNAKGRKNADKMLRFKDLLAYF